MRQIVLVRRMPESTDKKTGLGVYSDKVERIILEKGGDVKKIHMSVSKKEGYFRAIMNGFIRPFFETLSLRDQERTYHATDELCSMVFPFAKGNKVMTVHHVLRKDDNASFLYFNLWRLITKIGLRCADSIIATSPQTKKEVIENFNVDESKIIVAMSNLGPQFNPDESHTNKKTTIGCMGEFIPRKNMDSAVRTFKTLTEISGMEDLRLKMCGKGSGLGEIKHLISELRIEDKVEIVCDLTEEEIVQFYNESVVFSNPSRHEGLGLGTLEAQACGTPVVYFKSANIPTEVTRYAIPSDDEEEYVRNMHRLITDTEFRNKVISDGMEYAHEFGNDFGEKLMKIYKSFEPM